MMSRTRSMITGTFKVPTPLIPRVPVDTVQMFSRLGIPNRDASNRWPKTAKFETIGSNIVSEELEDDVKKVIQKGLRQENEICCSCTVPCETNVDCECLQMALALDDEFGGQVLQAGEQFVTQKDIWKERYWDRPQFACGSKCTCPNCCRLKSLKDIDTNHEEKYEVIRKDEKGFGLYTKRDIEKFHSVLSFNGVITGEKECKPGSTVESYSLQFVGIDKYNKRPDSIWKIPDMVEKFSDEFRNELKEIFNTPLYINPLKKGNIGRFLSHSCNPNMEIIRVFQGGVSPAHIRIIFIALRDVKNGEELTFHYGAKYVDNHLKGKCLCESCIKKRDAAEAKKAAQEEKAEKERVEAEKKKDELSKQRIQRCYSLREARENNENAPPIRKKSSIF